jgi:hypothetical protein
MLKPILECSREERLERALLAIEAFGLMADDADPAPASIMTKIYCIAHSATGRCRNPHEDWVKMIEECEKAGVEGNIYDAEKILNRERR